MALEITAAMLQTELRSYLGDDADSFEDRRLNRACISGLERLGRRRCWSFHRDTYPVATVTPYSTGTIAINIGSTTVTGTTTVFPSDSVGAWIEFDGQARAYEITARGGDTSLTIRNAYANADATNLSGDTYKIFYPSIDMPANFKSLRRVIDDGRLNELDIIDVDSMDFAHASRSGVGSPSCCGLRAKRNDPNIMQLFLYPSPDTQELYTVLYNRTPGWYSTSTVATASFALEPTTTSYYVDWPKNLKSLLLASCKLSLISEGVKGIDLNAADYDYRELLKAAEADDERQPEIEYLGRDSGPRQETWRIGV